MSDKKEKLNSKETKKTQNKNKKKTDKDIIVELKATIVEQKNNYLKSLANLENDRKRFEKTKTDFIKFANEGLINDLVNILDTFNMAMNIENPTPEVKNFLIGFKMISNQFNTLLNNNGVTEIIAKPGDDFDSNIHSSVEEVESKDIQSGKVVFVVKKGYKMNDRLLRPAMVKLAK